MIFSITTLKDTEYMAFSVTLLNETGQITLSINTLALPTAHDLRDHFPKPGTSAESPAPFFFPGSNVTKLFTTVIYERSQ
jgi:hypothetical protein